MWTARTVTGKVGASCASLALSLLCGGGLDLAKYFAADTATVPNAVAIDRALRQSALTQSEQPFHLVLSISPPAGGQADMSANIEIFWLNAVTYRTVIHSHDFTQTRIVNGSVIEEHDVGGFYPRWIENFVGALLDPVPQAAMLRKSKGTIAVDSSSHACISGTRSAVDDVAAVTRVCLQGKEPRITTSEDFTHYVAFDDFAPFGSQQIARTVVNDLPSNVLVRGRIVVLEPLAQSDYLLVKAGEFTLPEKRIETALVPVASAEAMLEAESAQKWNGFLMRPAGRRIAGMSAKTSEGTESASAIYVRTDRTGKVREAYPDSADIYGLQKAAVSMALTLKFKPLVVNGVPRQMEAPLMLPSNTVANGQ